eukprot:gene11202-4022_t
MPHRTVEIKLSQNLTTVDPNIFKTMITSTGISVQDLNDKGLKVLLFFTPTLGCVYVQGILTDIHDIKEQLLKLNTVPIIVHEETSETVEKMLNFSKATEKFKDLLFMEKKEFKTAFKTKILSPEESSLCLKDECGMKEMKRLTDLGIENLTQLCTMKSKPKEYPLGAVFLIHNSKVVMEYRQEKRYERFDIARIVLDTNGYGAKENKTSVFECPYKKPKSCKIEKMFNKIDKAEHKLFKSHSLKNLVQKSLTFKKTLSLQHIKQQQLDEKTIDLKNILDNSLYFEYFKLFATKEYCVENVLFYEEVKEYKKLNETQRKIRSLEMMDQFFDEDSINEINCSRNHKVKLFEEFKKYNDDLFDEVLHEVMSSSFTDMFDRFKRSIYFDQMLDGNQKHDYFLVV